MGARAPRSAILPRVETAGAAHAPSGIEREPRPPLRSGGLLVLLAALAALASAASCAAPPPPEPLAVESPVYVLESAPQAWRNWRFVPLAAKPERFPPDDEFRRHAAQCTADAANDDGPISDIDGDEAEERAHLAREHCLAERGYYPAHCSDGRDNDGDGAADHPADPGCAGPHALSESPQCDDGRDNDGDGLADWDGAGFTHPDPECVDDAAGTREAPPPRRRLPKPF